MLSYTELIGSSNEMFQLIGILSILVVTLGEDGVAENKLSKLGMEIYNDQLLRADDSKEAFDIFKEMITK